MENANRWYFTKDELANTPSRKCGIDANKELSYRQQAANFIQDMGQRLQVTQLCINTAIVYMHRFYVFHSFSEVHRNSLSVAALFLAAKVEEQPRKLEHVIKVAHVCLHKDSPPLDVRSDAYAEKQFEVVAHENVLLQTLGFVLAIEHPHTYVVKVCQLVKASKELAQTSYFMATTSLHMTTMCLQYRPTVVACVCIHLACKWSSWKIEPCSEGNEWYYYVDKSVTLDLLETLTQEFIAILETSPHKFKRCTKFNAQKEASSHVSKNSIEYNFKQQVGEQKPSSVKKEILSPGPSTSQGEVKVENCEKPVTVPPVVMQPSPKRPKQPSHSISIDAYREKKEKERIEQAVLTKSLPEPEKDAANVFSSEKAQNSQSIVSETQLANKVNHEVRKALSPVKFSKKEVKSTSLKIPSCVSNDPVVVLERVDVRTELEIPKKSEVGHLPRPESQNLHPAKSDRPKDLAVPKSKHSKPKPNSVPNSHGSPKRNSATNGSKDVELSDRKSCAETNRIEKKEKHKSKSKNKSLTNHSDHSNPSIKVKIRKDIIVLPEKSTPDKPLKIKLPKPPVSTPLKLVITKDKSGSGSYCTSHKNDKKRTHSPGSNEPSSKHARLDHSTPSGGKSGKHLGNDLSAERGPYNHHVSYHPSPGAVHRGRTDSNPPLPPIPPPQPPPPPE